MARTNPAPTIKATKGDCGREHPTPYCTCKACLDARGPEERLADHWRHKLKIPYSVWDALLQRPKPEGVACMGWVPLDRYNDENTKLDKARETIAVAVLRGMPLTRFEYHLAIAYGYLCPRDEVPYEEFYKKYWWETKDRFGYGTSEC